MLGMLRAGRLSEAEVAAHSQAGRVARGLSLTAVNLQGVWIGRAKYVPRQGTPDAAVQVRACSRAVCKTAHLDETRSRFAYPTVARQLADECRTSPDGGHVMPERSCYRFLHGFKRG
jgi:hypothetical protein